MRKSTKMCASIMLIFIMLTGIGWAGTSESNDKSISGPAVDTDSQKYFQKINEKDYIGKENFKLNVPETIKKYDLLLVNPTAFKKDADTGKMTVQLAGKSFDLEFEPGIYVSEGDKEIIVDENSTYMVDMPVVYTYYGTVVGYPENKVRFTVSDDAILGWIEVDDVKYIVSQSGSVKINEETKVLHTVYRNIDKEIAGIPVGADDVVEVPHDEYLIDNIVSSTSTMTILSTTTVDLLAVYDTEFSNEFASPGTEIYNMIADVNDAYGVSDISVNLDIDYYYYDSDLSSTSSSNLLYEFKNENSALRNSQNCDLAFLFSGKEFSDVPIGRAFQYTGSSTEGYAIGQMVNAPGYVYDGTFDERCILIAHEIGHNFGARHQIDTAPPSYARAYNWKYLGYYDRYTSMWYPYKGIGILSGMQLEFSSDTNHGDSTHDNARRISETKSTVASFQ